MRRLLTGLVIASLAVACTVQSTDKGSSSGGSSSGGSSSGGTSSNSDGGTTSTSSSSSGGSSSGSPAPSQTAAEVEIDGTCSAFVACGGDPQGTFDYTGGCIEDVFAGARGACSGLDTTKAIVKVKGSITFNGLALQRNVTVTTSGQITLPQSCTYGQCAMIENNLKGAFDSVSCTGSTDCTCTISKVESDTHGTTYTNTAGVIETADGDTYSICEKGTELTYTGKSAGSEQGTFTMKKR